eukprot:2146185-Pleurochrysis_carterae.AAC.3
MKEKACQTEVTPDDPIWDLRSSVLWANRAGCVVEDTRMVSAEILAQISDHMTLARSSCQEALFMMKRFRRAGHFASLRSGQRVGSRMGRRFGRSRVRKLCCFVCACYGCVCMRFVCMPFLWACARYVRVCMRFVYMLRFVCASASAACACGALRVH